MKDVREYDAWKFNDGSDDWIAIALKGKNSELNFQDQNGVVYQLEITTTNTGYFLNPEYLGNVLENKNLSEQLNIDWLPNSKGEVAHEEKLKKIEEIKNQEEMNIHEVIDYIFSKGYQKGGEDDANGDDVWDTFVELVVGLMDAYKDQPKEMSSEETPASKLRNLLTPHYSLPQTILLWNKLSGREREEIGILMVEQARVATKNKEEIKKTLLEIDELY